MSHSECEVTLWQYGKLDFTRQYTVRRDALNAIYQQHEPVLVWTRTMKPGELAGEATSTGWVAKAKLTRCHTVFHLNDAAGGDIIGGDEDEIRSLYPN